MADAAEDVEKYEAENAGWARTAKDLFAGAAGGVAQVLLGECNRRNPVREQMGELQAFMYDGSSLSSPSALTSISSECEQTNTLLQVNHSVSSRNNIRCCFSKYSWLCIRHRQSPPPDYDQIPQRHLLRNLSLAKRRCFSLLQGNTHPLDRHWRVCVRAVRRFPLRKTSVRGAKSTRESPCGTFLWPVLLGRCLCRLDEFGALGSN